VPLETFMRITQEKTKSISPKLIKLTERRENNRSIISK